jgi:hypothetical protein
MLLLPMNLPIGPQSPLSRIARRSIPAPAGTGASLRPAHADLLHPVFDQVAAGALDHARPNRPALGQIRVVTYIRQVLLSEAAFKTAQISPLYARALQQPGGGPELGERAFAWYNHEHHHTSLALLTPAQVHQGRTAWVLAARKRG